MPATPIFPLSREQAVSIQSHSVQRDRGIFLEIGMQKTCFKCGIEKPIKEFYKHPRMKDGHLNKCKECTKLDVSNRRHNPESRHMVLAYDRERGRSLQRKQKQAERCRKNRRSKSNVEAQKRWRDANLEKRSTHLKVRRAILSGKIVKTPCVVCGNPKSEGHHEDYSKPLEVIWLCREHHAEVHRKYK